MSDRLKVDALAKARARLALRKRKTLPDSRKFGLDKKQAKRLGINSGVERAKQISRSKYLPKEDAKAVARFYNRFKGCRTEKCEGSIDLWGGREFGRKASRFAKKKGWFGEKKRHRKAALKGKRRQS